MKALTALTVCRVSACFMVVQHCFGPRLDPSSDALQACTYSKSADIATKAAEAFTQ
jgi:hypothetical protein